jgi:hypothetical protein
MAKKIYKPRLHETGTVITTKTAYGSTSDMLIDLNNYTLEDGSSVVVAENEVVCKDDRGFYITFKNRVDSKLADPNRYANPKNRLNLVEKQQATT